MSNRTISSLLLTLLLLFILIACTGLDTEAITSQNPDTTTSSMITPDAVQLPAIHNTPSTPYQEVDGWELLFHDEFEGNALDPDNWHRCYWWGDQGCTIVTNNELQWYLPDNVNVDNGILTLEAREAQAETPNGQSYAYTSGVVTTGRAEWERTLIPHFVFQYGYAEIRAKVPKGQGLWSAFWLLPEYHRPTPEIDILEILGHAPNEIHMFLHYINDAGEYVADGESAIGPDFSADWHTFAVDWSPDALVWYVDNEEYRRIDDPEIIPATPMYLIMNLAVGGDWPGAPDASTLFPAHFEIDYVRVWGRHNTTTLTTVAHAAVDATRPDQVVAAGTELNTDTDEPNQLVIDDDPQRLVYLTFDTAPLADTTIDSAALRLWIDGDYGEIVEGEYALHLVEDGTTSDAPLTYANRPQLAAAPLGTFGTVEATEIYDIQLDIEQLQPYIGQRITFALLSLAGDPLPLYADPTGVQPIRLTLTSPRTGTNGEALTPPPPTVPD